MQIIVKGRRPLDPRERILAVEAAVRAICEEVGQDPADATMVLLTAAVHMMAKHSKRPITELAPALAECMGSAIVAADDFFKLRVTHTGER